MAFRLVMFDYDGTVADEGALPGPRVRAAVAAARAAGARVVLATGRSQHSAGSYAAELGLTDPLVCMQGALVLAADGSVLWTEPLPREPFREVLAFAEARGLDLNLYTEEVVYHVMLRYPLEFYERWFAAPMARVPSFAAACDELTAMGRHPLKGLFVGEPETNDGLLSELTARFATRLAVVRSHPRFVEVTSLAASKGEALARLAAHFGISRADTLAVGDSGNDLSMLRWAGLGVAMGNATPDVKAAAGWIAPPVHEEGLADAIERFVLRNGR